MEDFHLNVAFLYPEFSLPWHGISTFQWGGGAFLSISMIFFPNASRQIPSRSLPFQALDHFHQALPTGQPLPRAGTMEPEASYL